MTLGAIKASKISQVVRLIWAGKSYSQACLKSGVCSGQLSYLRGKNPEINEIIVSAIEDRRINKVQIICDKLEQGHTIGHACETAGVSTWAFGQWRKKYPWVLQAYRHARYKCSKTVHPDTRTQRRRQEPRKAKSPQSGKATIQISPSDPAVGILNAFNIGGRHDSV